MGKSKVTPEKIEMASRLRQIRKSVGMTQESFAELLEISLPAYKKIEGAENQVTIDGLRRLERRLKVSSDYVLFGKKEGLDETWQMILNCSENDKLFLMLRLISYFTKTKEGRFCDSEEQEDLDDDVRRFLKETRE